MKNKDFIKKINRKERPVWVQMLCLKSSSLTIFRVLLLLVIFEFTACVVLPLIVPNSWYLSWYLSAKAKKQTHSFLKGQNLLVPDDLVGWKNHPNMKKGNWIIDEHGSRSTQKFTKKRSREIRALFLGSSMINGGTHIRNEETISAYIEDTTIEALNFGTMLYSLDQSFLAYRYYLNEFNANVIIVGLGSGPTDGLKNNYIPFRFPEEENMPYLKPRFKVGTSSLELITVSLEDLLSNFPKNRNFFEFLSKNDSYYSTFEDYKRMRTTPILGFIYFVKKKYEGFSHYFEDSSEGDKLLEMLMGEMVEEVKGHDAEIIFLLLPNQSALTRNGIRHFFPDLYGRRERNLSSKGFNIIDVRKILLESGKPIGMLFQGDHNHFTALSNRIIANAIRPTIKKVIKTHK